MVKRKQSISKTYGVNGHSSEPPHNNGSKKPVSKANGVNGHCSEPLHNNASKMAVDFDNLFDKAMLREHCRLASGKSIALDDPAFEFLNESESFVPLHQNGSRTVNGFESFDKESGYSSLDNEDGNFKKQCEYLKIQLASQKQDYENQLELKETEKNILQSENAKLIQHRDIQDPLIKTYKDFSEVFKKQRDYVVGALFEHTGIKLIFDGKGKNVFDSDINKHIYPKRLKRNSSVDSASSVEQTVVKKKKISKNKNLKENESKDSSLSSNSNSSASTFNSDFKTVSRLLENYQANSQIRVKHESLSALNRRDQKKTDLFSSNENARLSYFLDNFSLRLPCLSPLPLSPKHLVTDSVESISKSSIAPSVNSNQPLSKIDANSVIKCGTEYDPNEYQKQAPVKPAKNINGSIFSYMESQNHFEENDDKFKPVIPISENFTCQSDEKAKLNNSKGGKLCNGTNSVYFSENNALGLCHSFHQESSNQNIEEIQIPPKSKNSSVVNSSEVSPEESNTVADACDKVILNNSCENPLFNSTELSVQNSSIELELCNISPIKTNIKNCSSKESIKSICTNSIHSSLGFQFLKEYCNGQKSSDDDIDDNPPISLEKFSLTAENCDSASLTSTLSCAQKTNQCDSNASPNLKTSNSNSEFLSKTQSPVHIVHVSPAKSVDPKSALPHSSSTCPHPSSNNFIELTPNQQSQVVNFLNLNENLSAKTNIPDFIPVPNGSVTETGKNLNSQLQNNYKLSSNNKKRKKTKKENHSSMKSKIKLRNQPKMLPLSPKNKIEQCLEDLENLKYNKKSTVNYRHALVNAMANPANATSTKDVLQYIMKYLLSSQRMPLSSYINQNDKTVLLPSIEECLIKAIIEVNKKERYHLQDLLSSFRDAVIDELMYNNRVVLLSLHATTCLCRTYAASFKLDSTMPLESQLLSVWVFCTDLAVYRIPYFPFAAVSSLSIWADYFQFKDISDFDSVQKLLIKLMVRRPSNVPLQNWAVCEKSIKSLFKEAGDEPINFLDMVEESLDSFKSSEDHMYEYYLCALRLVLLFEIPEPQKVEMANKIVHLLEDPLLLPDKKHDLEEVFNSDFKQFLSKEEH